MWSHATLVGRSRIRLKGKLMKILSYVSGKLIMVVIACSFAASIPIQAREARSTSGSARPEDDARLVVTRTSNFGTFQFVNLFVDGVRVANLGVNQGYEAVLRPGHHVLSISTTPQAFRRTAPTELGLNAEPGKIYAFTARWEDTEQAYVEISNGTKRTVTPTNPG
jgi:hypothetical protein